MLASWKKLANFVEPDFSSSNTRTVNLLDSNLHLDPGVRIVSLKILKIVPHEKSRGFFRIRN